MHILIYTIHFKIVLEYFQKLVTYPKDKIMILYVCDI